MNEPRRPSIVTPEMLRAGVYALRSFTEKDLRHTPSEIVVDEIFRAMLEAMVLQALGGAIEQEFWQARSPH